MRQIERDRLCFINFVVSWGSGLEFRPSVGKLSGIRHTEADVGTGTTSGDCESGRPTAIRTVRFLKAAETKASKASTFLNLSEYRLHNGLPHFVESAARFALKLLFHLLQRTGIFSRFGFRVDRFRRCAMFVPFRWHVSINALDALIGDLPGS